MPREEFDAVSHVQLWATESSRYAEIPTFTIGQPSATYRPPHPAGLDAPHYFALKRNGRLATMLPNQMLGTVQFCIEWLSISSANELQSNKKLRDVNARYTRILCYVRDKAIETSSIMLDFGIMNEAWSCWQLRTVMAYWNTTGFLDASVWPAITQADQWLDLRHSTGEVCPLVANNAFINPL